MGGLTSLVQNALIDVEGLSSVPSTPTTINMVDQYTDLCTTVNAANGFTILSNLRKALFHFSFLLEVRGRINFFNTLHMRYIGQYSTAARLYDPAGRVISKIGLSFACRSGRT